MGIESVSSVEILYNGKTVGKQKMLLLDDKTAFHLSAITRAFAGYEKNIKRLIKNTRITTVQWINMNHGKIKLKTIST
jgi:hypothetical protein